MRNLKNIQPSEDPQEEGAQAFRDGRHVQTLPQKYVGKTSRFLWEGGYWAAKQEEEDRQAWDAEVASTITESSEDANDHETDDDGQYRNTPRQT